MHDSGHGRRTVAAMNKTLATLAVTVPLLLASAGPAGAASGMGPSRPQAQSASDLADQALLSPGQLRQATGSTGLGQALPERTPQRKGQSAGYGYDLAEEGAVRPVTLVLSVYRDGRAAAEALQEQVSADWPEEPRGTAGRAVRYDWGNGTTLFQQRGPAVIEVACGAVGSSSKEQVRCASRALDAQARSWDGIWGAGPAVALPAKRTMTHQEASALLLDAGDVLRYGSAPEQTRIASSWPDRGTTSGTSAVTTRTFVAQVGGSGPTAVPEAVSIAQWGDPVSAQRAFESLPLLSSRIGWTRVGGAGSSLAYAIAPGNARAAASVRAWVLSGDTVISATCAASQYDRMPVPILAACAQGIASAQARAGIVTA